jgi:hypothetical protein
MRDVISSILIGVVGAAIAWAWLTTPVSPPGSEPEVVAVRAGTFVYRTKINGVSYLVNSAGGIIKEENQIVR